MPQQHHIVAGTECYQNKAGEINVRFKLKFPTNHYTKWCETKYKTKSVINAHLFSRNIVRIVYLRNLFDSEYQIEILNEKLKSRHMQLALRKKKDVDVANIIIISRIKSGNKIFISTLNISLIIRYQITDIYFLYQF